MHTFQNIYIEYRIYILEKRVSREPAGWGSGVRICFSDSSIRSENWVYKDPRP